jgi:Flp pilus assembly protein TadD
MRHSGDALRILTLSSAIILTGCEAMSPGKPTLDGDLDVIEATQQTDIMLTLAEPTEAVNYFRRKMAEKPQDMKYVRGLAISLNRAQKPKEAALVYNRLVDNGEATSEDRLLYAETLIKTGQIPEAEQQLQAIPPTVETYKRYLLEAIVADNNKDWDKSDSFYETARGLTTKPAPALNNWGMSKLARGDFEAASNLFQEAITFDPKLFSAKNNLVTARARKKNYRLPVIPMNETEEAQLLYNSGIIAVRQGDVDIGRGLFELAVETHPQHFPEAANALASLQSNVTN